MRRTTTPLAFLKKLSTSLARGRIEVRRKANDELTVLGWELSDLLLQLRALNEADFLRVETAHRDDRRVVWVFCPDWWAGGWLWVRLTEEEGDVVVVSFHLAQGDPWNE